MVDESSYIELFIQEQRRSQKASGTIRVREGHLNTVRTAFGTFDAVTRRTLDKWFLERGYTAGTKRSYVDTLSEFFKYGIQCHWFDEDPTESMSLAVDPTKHLPVTDTDLTKLLVTATKPELRSWLALAAYQGLRVQEIAGLSRENVDLGAVPPMLNLGNDSAALNKTSVIHQHVEEALRAVEFPRNGRLFPEYTAANIGTIINRHMKSCDVKGSSTSLLWWYRNQVQTFGQNFDRDTSANPSDELNVTPIELSVIAALDKLVPGESSCYLQATRDLNDPSRIAFRGVATEFRELVRVVLDRLAPDDIVKSSPGFKLDRDQIKPTQVQKTRFILKSHGVSDTARQVPEITVDLIEEHVGTFARNIYRRTSNSLHTDTDRSDVKQIKMYVDALLTEILQVHRPEE